MPAPSESRMLRSVHRLRLAAIGVGLTLLTFSQSSGFAAADTKLDLVVSPARFLRNAMTMWDPTAAAGQMQDQAYGYLFPMGPYYVVGRLAELPPWVVQRSWESLLLIVAFLGVVRLSRLLNVPGVWPRVGAGLVYALAPRMLMELGVISSELLPVVALPWVLIPLVSGSAGGSPRRAAARSGLALLFAGGINASATLAVLPVPALWLLTRSAGPRRRALSLWWVLATTLACLWWALPLAVLGRYSPPFLDWIESSTVTTGQTNLLEVLRGADHWQAYLGPSVWPAGWTFVASSSVVLATTAVAALGLGGLARTRTPNQTFLVASLVLGVVLVTLGHVATIGPPFAGSFRALLDGALNAFRNVHKFDPVIRLPMAIGAGHGLAAMARWARRHTVLNVAGAPVPTRLLVAGIVIGVGAVAIAPALTGRIVPSTRTANDPSWWASTASWLDSHSGGGRALVVPGAGAPVYLWGSPRDDALQPLARSPWTVRDVAPLTQPGYVRLLDEIESSLATGRADPALPDVLARAGIRYLVVRNDLETTQSGATPLRFVHAAVAATSAFTEVARFGPDLEPPDDPSRLVDLGLTRARGTVDIYENGQWRSEVSLLAAAGTVVANGSSDDLPALVDAGLTPRTPVVFGDDPAAVKAAGVPTTHVLTDGIRRREFGFGSIDKYSQTLTANSGFAATRAAHDYLPADAGTLSTVSYSGISDVTASSSAADVTQPLYSGSQYSPWAAVDTSASTAWRTATLDGAVGQWLSIRLQAEVSVPAVSLAFAARQGSFPTRLRVTTDAGSVEEDVAPDAELQQVRLPSGSTRSLRLTVLAVADGGRGSQVGVQRLIIPGVQPARSLDVVGPARPDQMVFRVADGYRAPCLPVSNGVACDPSWATAGEEDTDLHRGFALSAAAAYGLDAQVRLVPGAALDALLDAGNPILAGVSSTDSDDPNERAGAAVDGIASTGWVAAQGDRTPSITLAWTGPTRLTGITISPMTGAPVTAATQVRIRAGATVFTSRVPADGKIVLPRPVRTSTVTIRVTKATLAASTDSLTGQAHLLPVGIRDIALEGTRVPVGKAAARVSIGCDAGIDLGIDGAAVHLRVDVPSAKVLDEGPVPATPCARVPTTLAAGRHEIALGTSAFATPESITLTRSGATTLASLNGDAGTATVRTWSDTHRTVRVSTKAAAFLMVRENANAGWHATLDGVALAPVMLDGWAQGWLMPAGAHGTVALEYVPQRAVDIGFISGVVGVVVLIALASVRRRREHLMPSTREAARRVPAEALCLVATTVLGGLVGLAIGGVAVVASRVALAGHRTVPPWLAPAVLLLAGIGGALRPAGSANPFGGTGTAQVLGLLALAVVVLALRPSAPRNREMSEQRTLDQVPRHGRRRRRRKRGQEVEPEEVPAEGSPPHPPLDRE